MLFSEFLVQCLTALEKVTGSTSMLQSEKRQGLNRKVVKYLNFARSYQSISTTRRQRLCEDIADMFGERDTFISATQSGISPDIAIATAGKCLLRMVAAGASHRHIDWCVAQVPWNGLAHGQARPASSDRKTRALDPHVYRSMAN
eukprot:scaffold2608_cov362-Prasinococcus_capsulatus_cf.AAC.6